MIVDLDHERAHDPIVVGSKAARLAIARRNGVPVPRGLIVSADESRSHMQLGARALSERGSGGARLAVTEEALPIAAELVDRVSRLGTELVARSSTLLEGSGEWAGAFTSYLDVKPHETPKAVTGCWASAFSVDALERQEATGVEPGTVDMAVLIQPVIDADWGGVAEVADDGTIVVDAVQGTPAPLLQGWVMGQRARRDPSGAWTGDELIDGLGEEALDDLVHHLATARGVLGANRCEWAFDGEVWILQLEKVPERAPRPAPAIGGGRDSWLRVVRALVHAPGALGEELVLPWVFGLERIPDITPRANTGDADLEFAESAARELTAQAWGMPPEDAFRAGRRAIDTLASTDPESALEILDSLHPVDPSLAGELLSALDGVRHQLSRQGVISSPRAAWFIDTPRTRAMLAGERPATSGRVGTGRWEQLVSTVTLVYGQRTEGMSASPGLGAGLPNPHHQVSGAPPPRSVIVAGQAVPSLSQVLWDATALVTGGGSPSAHVFESARSLGVPAVTGVSIDQDLDLIVAVDGYEGIVSTVPRVSASG